MSKFKEISHFVGDLRPLQLLPISFERFDNGRYLVSNMVGDFVTLSASELDRVTNLDLTPGDQLYELATENLFVAHEGQETAKQLIALRLRSRLAFLRSPTPLHIFVVTLRCEHSCPYCQVSRRSMDHKRFDMDIETAQRAVSIVFQSPAPLIKIEFQGGEPLLNFPLIRYIVGASKEAAGRADKAVEFVITTNLALLTEDILDFCLQHNVLLSTSLDGPEDLHNRNRPRPGGNSHALAVQGIRRAKEILGSDKVGALMTTTSYSLKRVKDIVDEYLRNDLDGIFLRPLSPYGFALKTRFFEKYSGKEWSQFYSAGLEYILKINRSGKYFPEFYAALLVRRMSSEVPTGYVDLRSPAGIGLGALVYNYDGKVFASDEGRMLAEMDDKKFEIGNVIDDDYNSLILADSLVSAVAESMTQCAPMCSSCAFEPHCGADPVYHYATQGDVTGIKPLSAFCSRQKFMFKTLIDIMDKSPEDAAILRRWAQ